MRALIISADNFEDAELLFPYYRLKEEALSFPIPHTSMVYEEDKGRVIPCFRNVCYEPIERTDILSNFLVKLSTLPS